VARRARLGVRSGSVTLAELRALLAELGLELAEAKTRLVRLHENGEGFDFLGFHHRMVESERKPGRWFLARFPSARATQAARARIREITDRRRLWLPPEEIVADLNRSCAAGAATSATATRRDASTRSTASASIVAHASSASNTNANDPSTRGGRCSRGSGNAI
jgi:hypothetical protein